MRVLRWTFAAIVILLIVITGSIVATVKSPRVMALVVTKAVSLKSSSFKIRDLSIGSQKVAFPFQWSFDNVKFRLSVQKSHYDVDMERLDVTQLSGFFAPETSVKVETGLCKVKNDNVSLDRARTKFTVRMGNSELSGLYGDFSVDDVQAYAYKLTNIHGQFRGNSSKMRLPDLTAEAYGGLINAEVLMEYKPSLNYSVKADIQNVDLDRLGAVNKAIFTQAEGIVSGKANLSYKKHAVDSLGFELVMPTGGKLNMSLAKLLMMYIPIETQIEVEGRLKQGEKFWAELFQLKLRSMNQNTLSGDLQIQSRELKTNFNIPIDIKMDGNLNSVVDLFLDGFRKFSQVFQ